MTRERIPDESGSSPIVARNVWKIFRRKTGERVRAVVDVSIDVRAGALTALVGPDGAGKTTLLRLVAGLFPPTHGKLDVLGVDVAAEPQIVQERIGYMPQKFGLYEDLSVRENLDLYADIHGVSVEERAPLYDRLLSMTALAPFTERLAGKLSGGMKQKLGLACTLVRSPRLLVLDEPTVGVDPLSRRDLWEILTRLVRTDGLTVLLSTSYLDEAERCDHAIVMRNGAVLADGPPQAIAANAAGRTFVAAPTPGQSARSLQARLIARPNVADAQPFAGQVRFVTTRAHSSARSVPPRFEDGFIVLMRGTEQEVGDAPAVSVEPALPPHPPTPPPRAEEAVPVVEVIDLVRRFGRFTAVDHLSFSVRRGDVFGLLGANGAGKTTTFRMLCGLLPATSGTLRVAGANLLESRAEARQRLGYMAQKFSLYSSLTVRENLEFFSRAYGLRGARMRQRIDWALAEFELGPFASLASGELPGGFKQRLSLAAALLHQPDILFLDEPTSGADPVARREFWSRINLLADRAVTVVVTTHFMEEAEYCDRILILDAGRALAEGTPAELRARARPQGGREQTMEDAFVAIVEDARTDADDAAARRAG